MQAKCNTVLDVSLHARENLPGRFDGRDDGGEALVQEDNIGGGTGSISGTLNGDTTVGTLRNVTVSARNSDLNAQMGVSKP